jgi:putative transposase
VACRVLKISRSGYYEWRDRPLSPRELDNAYLANTVVDIHTASRGSYGTPRMHAELRIGRGLRVSRKRVAGLLRLAGLAGIGGNTHRKRRKRAMPAAHEDRVQRRFVADAPNRLWCTDLTEHATATGKVYCCAVLDVFSRVVVGWSIADHMRAELVVDALQMATWRRRPDPGAIVHADRGSQGGFNWSSQHLDRGGVDGQAGRVDDCADRAVANEVAGGAVASTGGRAQVLA